MLALADANPRAGLGHVARVSAVAYALRARGLEVRCFGLGAEADFSFDGVVWTRVPERVGIETAGASAVLLDSYELDESTLGFREPLIKFYDGGKPEPSQEVAVVVAPALDHRSGSRWLSGLTYACLRPRFWGAVPRDPVVAVTAILVTTGATDPGSVSRRLVQAALEAVPCANVRRIRGPGCEPLQIADAVDVDTPPDLRDELRRADLVIGLGGQTALEAACLGIPTVAVAAVENQRPNVARLAAAGAAEAATLGEDLPEQLAALARDHERRLLLSRRAREAVDGFGALRVAARIELLVEKPRP